MIYSLFFSIFAGISAGTSAVAVFNRLPVRWLCDYGEEPCGDLIQAGKKRIEIFPWNVAFSTFFTLAAFMLAAPYGFLHALAALAPLWLLLEISVADIKYMIIPDQFVLLLALAASCFLPYHSSLLSPLYGAAVGGGCMFAVGVAGKLIYKKEALGFGDVKLFAAVGLIAGPLGVSLILAFSSFLSCLAFCACLLLKRIKRTDVMPLGPYIFLAYFFHELLRSTI